MNVSLEYCDPFDGKSENLFMKLEHCGRYLYACDRFGQSRCHSALDVACASGYGSWILSSRGFSVVGLDRNELYISKASTEKRDIASSFYVVDFDREPFPATVSELDCAVCFETIEHLEYPVRLLRMVYNSLRKGGIFLLSFPNPIYEKTDENGNNKDPFHKHIFEKEQVVDMLREVGFSVNTHVKGQSLSNLAYNRLSYCKKNNIVDENLFEKQFMYDVNSIIRYAYVLAYPDVVEVESSYSFIMEAYK